MSESLAETTDAIPVSHLAPALVAVALVCALVAGCLSYARRVEARYIHTLAPLVFEQKNTGSALQAEAFRQPDLLPLYGSSEMRVANPYHPSTLLRTYPTGFTVFPVGKPGTTCLVILQDVAAVGPALRGKKVAVSLTPSWFFEGGMLDAAAYAGNFSRLHAGELVFATALSLPLKQGAARRMLQYPATLKGDPLLRFAVGRLAAGSPPSLALYYAALPLGKLQNLILKVQDHVEVIDFILRQPSLEPILPRREAPIDWNAALPRADREYRRLSDNNPFGFLNPRWSSRFQAEAARQKGSRTDNGFLDTLTHAAEWTDLHLLLLGLKELGAEPIILCMPIHGRYYDYWGVSLAARKVFYEQLRSFTDRHGVPAADFFDHDDDTAFLIDHGHLSEKGWVYYDRAIDAFYHGRPVPAGNSVALNWAKGPVTSAKASPTPRSNYAGHHGTTNCGQIAGWAWDSTRPDTPVNVDIYDGETLIATVVADSLRNDLLKANKGNGKHAFSYRVPDRLKDGGAHSIRVRIAGTSIDLADTPKPLQCGPR